MQRITEFKRIARHALTTALAMAALVSTIAGQTQAATNASFDQTAWTGGVTANVATDAANRTGWMQYSASTAQTASTITLPLATTTITQTSDATSVVSGFKYGAYANASTTFSGSATSTSIVLTATSVTDSITATNDSTTVATSGQAGGWAYGSVASTEQNGQSGDAASVTLDNSENNATPTIVAGYRHSLALKANGTVWAWGANETGQLGDNSIIDRIAPVQVSSLSDVTAIAAGSQHSLALKANGTVWAWGANSRGQLGDNSTTNRITPVQVSGLSDVTAIAAGEDYTLALKANGTVWAWGANGYTDSDPKSPSYNQYIVHGQLGSGVAADQKLPIQVSGLSDVTAIAAGGEHSLALKTNGSVWAWGVNYSGQLGDNSFVQRNTPVQVSGLSDVTAIATGVAHSLARKSDGTVWAWGGNSSGQLGDNSTTERKTPVQVSGLSNVTAIKAGASHSLARKSDGTVWAWGGNLSGQLGDNSFVQRNTPVQVSGLTGVTAIAGGSIHSLARKSDGTVWAWGANNRMQLGDNSTTQRVAPVQVGYAGAWLNTDGVATYATTGTYTSYLDAGSASSYIWNSFAYTGQYPAGTTLSIKAIGSTSTSTPSFASGTCNSGTVAANGTITLNTTCAPTNSRYLWYQVSFANGGNTAITPSLDSVTGSVTLPGAYATSGTFTSGVLDSGSPVANWGNISWTNSGGQTVSMKVRTGTSEAATTAAAWGTATTTSGATLASLGATAGHRYIQYQATLSNGGNTAVTPSLDDVTLTYGAYATSGSATSSIYNTTSAYNTMTGLVWKETATLPAGTSVTVSLRTGASTSTMGAWTAFTNATAGCTKPTDTVTCAASAIPASMMNGSGDQYFQYKVDITSTGQNTPTVSQVKPSYTYNVPPTIASLSATQIATSSDANFGNVKIDFALRDTDSTSLKATTTFEYSTNGGSTWNTLATNQLATVSGTAFNNVVTVATGSNTSYSAYWNVRQYLANTSSATFKVRMTAIDGDAFNGTASSTSANASVDTIAPTGYSITANPINNANKAAASFTFAGAEVGTTYTYIWARGATTTGSGTIASAGQTISNIDLTTLSDGTSTLAVSLRDAAGNQGATTTINVLKDATAPTGYSITANPINNANKAAASFTFAGAEVGTTYTYIWARGATTTGSGTIASAGQTISNIDLTTLSDGTSTLAVSLRDAAGNQGATTTINILKDVAAPTIASFSTAAYATSTTVSLNLSASDANGIANILLSNDGSAYTSTSYAATKSWTVTSGDGAKTIYFKVVDNAGNTTSATSTTVTLDTTNPTGSISVPTYSTSTASLTLSASDTNNVTQMQFANDGGAYAAFEAYETTKAWPLSAGDGQKTVSVKFKDAAGNISAAYTATTTVDSTAPTGTISINAGASIASSTSVTLDLSASDVLSGVNQMQFSTDGSTYSALESYATSKAYTLPSTQGTTTVYVKFTDNAGNISSVYSDAIVLDTTAPTIASFSTAAYATSTTVSLNLSASDANGIANILLSNDGSAYTSTSYAATKSWTITEGDGAKTIYFKVVDNAGNTTSATSTTVTLDTTNPTGSISVPTYSTSTASLTLSASDTNNVTQMQFANDGGAYAAFEAYETTKAWPLSAGDGQKTVSVKFKDAAGNISAAYTATTTVDSTAPTGTISINAGASIASSTSVTLDLSASDVLSGVNQMQFSNNGTDWDVAEVYATTKAYAMPSGDGTKTVHVRFIDNAGNESTSTSDTILLDTSIPTLASDSLLINGNATTDQSETASVTLSLQNVAGQPEGETVYVQFSRNGSQWYGANANGTVTANEWGSGFESDEATIASLSWPWTLQSKVETISMRIKDGVVDGVSTDDNQGTYNIAPVVSSVTASQQSDATVRIEYALRDADNGTVTAELEYSTDGSNWNTLDTDVTGQSGSLSVNGSDTTFVATWDAQTTLVGTYDDSIYVRVAADDGELLNNSGSATSSAFAVDAKAPTISGLLIDGSATPVEAETASVMLAIDGLQGYPTGEEVYAQFSRDGGTTWYGYANGTSTQDVWGDAFTTSSEFAWTLAGRSETITVRAKDIFGNISETASNQAAYNIRPEVVITGAVQATSTGSVVVTFAVRDADTFTSSVAPTYQYSTNGSTWSTIDPQQLSVTDANGVSADTLAVTDVAATYTATWDAKTQFPNAVTNVFFKVSVDDAQPIKNIGTATSSAIVVDAKAPTLAADSFLINDSAEIAIASSRDITFKLQNVTGNPIDEMIQARFSRDNGATWSPWSASFATDAATLGETTFPWTMAGRSETLLVSIRDIFGNESETTDENGAGYNLRPQIVSGPTAEQVTDPQNANYGKVVVSYTVKDEDTAEGSTPGQITPTIAYSTNGGTTWNEIASSSAALALTGSTDGMQPVAASDTILSAAWDAKADLGATYNQNMQVKLTINDNEGIFNLATATSSIFAIDTTDPVIVSAAYNGVTQRLAFHFTDEAAFQYRVSASPLTATSSATTTENANDGAWQDATASVNMTREWVVTATSTAPTVYVQVRDAYGNLSEKTVIAPIAPSRVDFKDNSTGENYIEFVSWPVYTSVSGAQFKQYDLYRSVDDGAFEKIGSSITTRGTNYRTDENLSAGATYAYKVAVTDTDNDVSLFSAPISDIPDGRGSSDALPPIISAVSAPTVQSLWAKIVWTTDEEADSIVEYGTSPSYGFTKTEDAMVKNHEVIVNNLTPDTDYFFKVTSKDGGNNSTTDDNGAAGYLFTTPGGPVISGVTASSSDKTATITWTTDKDSDSHVFYSKNSAFNGYNEAIGSLIGGPTSTAYVHSLTLADLDPGSTYYFYVQSTTAEGNASLDNNGGSYYTFRTSSDIYPPVISGIATPVRTSQSTVIFWKTNEPATSQVQYGIGTSSLNLSSDYDSTLSTYHSVTLDDLAANTTYQFNVVSLDLAGNRGVSTTTAFTTTKEGEVKIVTVGGASAQTPAEAKDTTPPVISDVAVATTTAFTATITFNTSEPAISSVQYGRDADYGDIAGEKDYATRHTIRLSGLKMGTEYHFQVQTRDKVGNAAASADATFKTKFFSQANAGLKTIENLQQYEDEVEQSIESILPGILPPFVEEARVTDVTENSATVFWRTNVRSYGVVSFGTEEDFAKAANTSAAYTGEVSDTNAKTLEHTLQLIGLKPNTKYHFKVKSFSLPQVVGEGNDLTFVTKAPKVSASIIDIKNTSFRVIWSTDTPASTIVEYKNTKTGITERIIDEKPVAYHDILVERVVPGVSYEVRVFGYSASGALIESGTSLSVLTSRDIAAPKISNFKVDGALVPGRTDRVQTVVTWTTDEPSNSTVYYQEGAGQVTKDFANKAEQLDAYTTNHAIILSNLKPGTIYQMKIESVDTAGNKASFGPRTIITPQKGESIFDVIFKNFEDTFKFLRAAGQ